MRRQTAVVLVVLGGVAAAVFAGRPVYTSVDVLALSAVPAHESQAYDGRRVRLEGLYVSRLNAGPLVELTDGVNYDSSWHSAARASVVPVAGDPPPADGEEAVYWGTLNVSRHEDGKQKFTLVADRPGGFWSGPPLELFRLGWTLAVLPYLGVAAAVLLAVRRTWQVERLRRQRPGRCPTCGYDIRGSPGRCPECGRETGGTVTGRAG